MAKEKPHINLVVIGHVDHGKSTTVGRLLFDSGNIDEQTMRKLKEKAQELGKGGFEFAFVMDNLKEERERGVTIDLAHKRFDTEKYYFTIIIFSVFVIPPAFITAMYIPFAWLEASQQVE